MGHLADACFDRYVRRLVSRNFAMVRWLRTGLQAGHASDGPGGPSSAALFVANHSSWWDGFLGWLVSRELGLRFHILMDADNLDRYWMFKWIGALPMHRADRRAAYRDLVAAGERLSAPASSLWIFPQGARRPPADAIVHTERGAAHLAIETGVQVVPVAFRYHFLEEQFPEAFIQVGAPFTVEGTDRRLAATAIEQGLQATVEQLDDQLRSERLEAMQPLLAGRVSINRRLDRVRGLDRPF